MSKEYFKSIGHLIKRIFLNWFGLVCFLLSLFEIAKIILSENNLIYSWLSVLPSKYLFISLLIFSVINAYHRLRLENKRLIKLNSDIDIIFDSGESYDQKTPVENGDVKQYRIKVKNKGYECMKDIEVKVVSIDPCVEQSQYLPLILRQMHDLTIMNHQEKFNLNPGDHKFIDVVSKLEPNASERRDCNYFSLDHIYDGTSDVKNIISLEKNRTLVISAQGQNTEKCEKSFLVYGDAQGKLHFEEVK